MHALELGMCCARDILRDAFGLVVVEKALDPLDADDFVKLSAVLANKLTGITEELQGPAIKQALKTLDVDWPNLSEAAKSKVIRQANKAMLFPNKKIGPAVQAEFERTAKQVMPNAKESATAKFKLGIPSTFNAEDKNVAQFVMANQGNYVTNALGQRIQGHTNTVRNIVSDGIAQGKGRREIAQEIWDSYHGAKGLKVNGLKDNKFYYEVVAASFMNRARTAASLSAFKQAGVQFYIWDSVLDEATTETCRFMHNKRFPVEGGLKQIEDVATADDPEAIKTMQPWVRDAKDADGNKIIVAGTGENRITIATVQQAAAGKMDAVGQYTAKFTDQQLFQQGISMPPIHGLCRSTVLADSKSISAPVKQPTAPAVPAGAVPPVDPKAAKARAAALSKMGKLPKSAGGMGRVHKFATNTEPTYMDAFAPDEVETFVEQGKGKFRKPKREDVLFNSSVFDPKKVEDLIKSPKALADAQAKTILLKHNGKIYLFGDQSAAVASRLLGQRRIAGRMIDLDKIKPSVPSKPLTKPKAKPKKPLPKVVPKPQVTPKPPKMAPPEAHKNILHEKTGSARGSNDGGFYRGKDGVNRYVKFYDDPTQAASEHLANQLYRDLGLEAPNSQVFKTADGRLAYASDIFEGGKTLGSTTITKARATKAMDGFVGDVLTGNWDAAGLSHDNMMVLPSGKVARIDNGGTFLFRAKYGRKPPGVLNAITEWDKLLDPSVNPSYSQLASKAEFNPIDARKKIISQVDKLLAVQKANGGWAKYVDRVAPQLGTNDRKAIVGMLNSRTDLLKKKRLELKKYKPPPKPKPGDTKWRWKEKPVGGAKPRKGLRFEDLPEKPIPVEYNKLRSGMMQNESIRDYRARIQKSLNRLTNAERYAIEEFTGNGYGEVRWSEEEGKPNRAAKLIKSGLAKLDPEPRTVYRGISGLPTSIKAEFLEKEIIALGKGNKGASTSTSWKPDVSLNWQGTKSDPYSKDQFNVFYRINGKTCKGVENISMHEHERELMFDADARFRVTGISRVRGQKRVIMIEAEEIIGPERDKILAQERKRTRKAMVLMSKQDSLPPAFVDHGEGRFTVRGVDMDEDWPDEVWLPDKPIGENDGPNGRAVKLTDVHTLTREELLIAVVDHPVFGLIRPWRNVWGVGL